MSYAVAVVLVVVVGSVRLVFRALQLHLEPLGADLKAVHRLNRGLRRYLVVVRYEAETFGQIRLLVDEYLRAEHVTERRECLREVRVGEFGRQMIDEQVRAVGTFHLLAELTVNCTAAVHAVTVRLVVVLIGGELRQSCLMVVERGERLITVTAVTMATMSSVTVSGGRLRVMHVRLTAVQMLLLRRRRARRTVR